MGNLCRKEMQQFLGDNLAALRNGGDCFAAAGCVLHSAGFGTSVCLFCDLAVKAVKLFISGPTPQASKHSNGRVSATTTREKNGF